MIDKQKFRELLDEYAIKADKNAVDRFDIYAEKLVEYNRKVNLTAITDADEIAVKHFLDSLLLTKYVDFSDVKTVCDVGTGAGFPGVCLLIARPDIQITLMDSVNKKLDFIRFLLKELDLQANVVNIRAEDAGKVEKFREKFDFVTARAVASLNQLSEFCIPLVKVGGVFAPMKAALSDEEKQRGFSAVKTLGCEIEKTYSYTVADYSREIIVCRKTTHTNPKYPRNYSQISKKPL